MMTSANERRKAGIMPWLGPALLAVIVALMVLGGGNVLSNISGLRDDFQKNALQNEKRLTHLEDANIDIAASLLEIKKSQQFNYSRLRAGEPKPIPRVITHSPVKTQY
jgi:hypothetical protein